MLEIMGKMNGKIKELKINQIFYFWKTSICVGMIDIDFVRVAKMIWFYHRYFHLGKIKKKESNFHVNLKE